jgi:arachidonate 15-lipoxygenase
VVKGLPTAEFFSPLYIFRQVAQLSVVAANLAVAKAKTIFDRFDELQDYEDLFPLLPDPSPIGTFQTDEEFGKQRLAGVNPMVLRRIDELPSNFPLDQASFQAVAGPDKTIGGEAADGRLFLADYAILEGIELGTYRGQPKHMVAPLALFHWTQPANGGPGKLMPLAIQLSQQPGPEHPIFTPLHGTSWSVAKIFVQVAEVTQHKMVSHLGRTHLLIEPFAIATARQLAKNHPLSVLLKPHYRFTLAINKASKYLLVNKGGFVDRLFAGTLSGTLSIAKQSHPENFYDLAAPTELKSRGVDDLDILPEYPYRDDALLIWDAVAAFVKNYLALHYGTDGHVLNDYELQNWFGELTADTGGRLHGVTRSGHLNTRDELSDLITQLIFTCGPQHAAVNFPQYDYLAYAPNMPFAAYTAPPADMSPGDETTLMDLLLPMNRASAQILIIRALTAFRTERLGDYGSNYFADLQTREVVGEFQTELLGAEASIDERNQVREPYHFLKPSMIPNSGSI